MGPARDPVEAARGLNRSNEGIEVVGGYQHSGTARVDDLQARTGGVGDDRRTDRHGFDHHQPEGFGPRDGEQRRLRAGHDVDGVLLGPVAHHLDVRTIEQRRDLCIPVGLPVRPW